MEHVKKLLLKGDLVKIAFLIYTVTLITFLVAGSLAYNNTVLGIFGSPYLSTFIILANIVAITPVIILGVIIGIQIRKPEHTPEREVAPEEKDVVIIDSSFSPYIKPNVKSKTGLWGKKELALYKIDDYQFRLKNVAHTLIVGTTGAGKSTFLFSLLQELQAQYPNSKFAICDAGNFDFENALAYKLEDITKVITYLHKVMLQRQAKKEKDAKRIFFILEEAEAFLTGIQLLPKAEYNAIINQLGDIGRLARKTNINMVWLLQNGKADVVPTTIRGNFGCRFFLTMVNNKLSSSLGCPHNTKTLPLGMVYNNLTDSLFTFPKVKEPTLPLVTLSDLHKLAHVNG